MKRLSVSAVRHVVVITLVAIDGGVGYHVKIIS